MLNGVNLTSAATPRFKKQWSRHAVSDPNKTLVSIFALMIDFYWTKNTSWNAAQINITKVQMIRNMVLNLSFVRKVQLGTQTIMGKINFAVSGITYGLKTTKNVNLNVNRNVAHYWNQQELTERFIFTFLTMNTSNTNLFRGMTIPAAWFVLSTGNATICLPFAFALKCLLFYLSFFEVTKIYLFLLICD